MSLVLEYKQGDNYCVYHNNQRQMVTVDTLIQLINSIPERNCKVVNGNVCMKAGYGKLPIKRLVNTGYTSKGKNRFIKNKENPIIIYTNDSYKQNFNENDIILNINYYFKKNISKIIKELDALDRHYIKVIDKAKVIEVKGRLFVQSDDGVTTLDNISIGCKTCILANHYSDKLINLTLCGENAIKALFDVLSKKGSSNSFLLLHSEFLPLYKYNIRINNKVNGSLFDLYMTLAEELSESERV